jgi:hypothetical protein
MLFMIIERFRDNDILPIYQRIRNEGRMFPEGLKYIARIKFISDQRSRSLLIFQSLEIC